jgi:hypothetical protein
MQCVHEISRGNSLADSCYRTSIRKIQWQITPSLHGRKSECLLNLIFVSLKTPTEEESP